LTNAREEEMRKSIYGVLGLVVLLVALFVTGGTKEAFAEVNVNINIGPPPIVVAEPPAVVFMPPIGVYFVPQVDFDVFFYSGFWWSPRGSSWYRAREYNGPWGVVDKRYVPAPVYRVPKDYRNRYEKEKHIPYGEWKKQGKHHEEKGRGKQKEDQRREKQDHGHGKKGD